MTDLCINFGSKGQHLESKTIATEFREQIVKAFPDIKEIICNFKGIENITEAFADECFGKLIFKFSIENIRKKLKYSNASPSILKKISDALENRHTEAEWD